jgi:hypothetical protein
MVSVYAAAVACMIHGACHQGWFLVQNTAFLSCERDVMPLIEGHLSKDKAGNTLVWHAKGCMTGKTPPQGEMLGMF